ncbi:hypothetical protein DL771_007750 [Monosporascus sp. 5C6A]|nr:hypothetical protein DL771_007750 [Monosporascus sp. 5C6A]
MRQSPEASLETAGESDIFRHFAPNQPPRSGPDTTLSAFAQLVALRLNTTRALISLIDRTKQYILVEATQTSRLLSDGAHNDSNDLLFGSTTLPRSTGLCGHALETFSPREAGAHQDEWWRPSPFVVNDLAYDDKFNNRPFVTSHPSLRFYAAMPIRTESGLNIGTLSVMDERPRQGLNDLDAKFLGDMALIIMSYLQMARYREGHRRSEKMIKGLGVFMEGRTDLNDWWLELGNKPRRHTPEEGDGAEAESQKEKEQVSIPASGSEGRTPPGRNSGDEVSKSPSSPGGHTNRPRPTLPGTNADQPLDDGQPVPTTEGDGGLVSAALSQQPFKSTRSEATACPLDKARAPSRGRSSRTFTPDFQESRISERLKEMFARAGHIIQESIEVDGALFLDAHISTLSERRESIISNERAAPSQACTSDTASSENSAGNDDASQPVREVLTEDRNTETATCEILGLRTRENLTPHGDGASKLVPLAEARLQSLLQKYPHGHVFSAGERQTKPRDKGVETKSRSKKRLRQRNCSKNGVDHTEADADALFGMLPDARNIAFIPLWDSHTERWFAGGFMWTVVATTRVLTRTEDLNYLAAFGNSIMVEVARLDVVGADRVKSDFISSISHELRSPLHGILASVELLQETQVDLFQHGMIDTIERCGRTLLDTIQHVLDFAKINTFTGSRSGRAKMTCSGSPPPLLGTPSRGIDTDLGLLVEDVVDSVFAGHEFQGKPSHVGIDAAANFPSESFSRRNSTIGMEGYTSQNQHGLKKDGIDIVMDIGYRSNWTFNTQSGAVRRIVMNLFGNALKYTNGGWVKVSLQAKDIDETPSQPSQSVVTISISDTGRGITQEYLQGGLFTPFTQEDPMNPGTGLGLSIVLKLVRSLKGIINITSEQGVGTEVVVTLTLNQTPSIGNPRYTLLDRESEDIIQSAQRKSSGRTICLLGLDVRPPGGAVPIPERRPSGWQVEEGWKPSLSLQASVESLVTDWFGMKIAELETQRSSPPDIYLANENPGLRSDEFAGVPTIVLCSHEALYREYSQRKTRGGQHGDGRLLHFVSKPCGPRKLAKAFMFCLGNASHVAQPFSSGVSTESLASPQNLFQSLPEDRHMSWLGHHSGDDYFAPTTPSRVDEPLRLPENGNADAEQEQKRKPLLLLVEDNGINLRLLSTFVSKGNYDFDTAGNGLVALQAFEVAQRPYDVVFMDISMPVMDGMAATREIRKLEHVRRQRPSMIIALTGLSSASCRQEALSSGIDMFLTKPVRLKDIQRILDGWVPDSMETDSRRV